MVTPVLNNARSRLMDEQIMQIAVLPPESRQLLFEGIIPRSLCRGDDLLQEGQVCKNIYFIEQGLLRSFYDKNGREINTNFSFEHHFITNLKSLLSGLPSRFYIRAVEPTVVWEFDWNRLLYLYSVSHDIESFGRKLLEKLLIKQEDHSNWFKLYTPAERYHYVAECYPGLLQRVSLSQLSSYLGISRETISRIRKNTALFHAH